MAAVVLLSAQTPVITGSIRLPSPAWKLLSTVRTSAPNRSCLATQSPEKKAKEPDRKQQREWAWQRNNQGQRASGISSKHWAPFRILRTLPPQPPVALAVLGNPVSQCWSFFPFKSLTSHSKSFGRTEPIGPSHYRAFESRGKG